MKKYHILLLHPLLRNSSDFMKRVSKLPTDFLYWDELLLTVASQFNVEAFDAVFAAAPKDAVKDWEELLLKMAHKCDYDDFLALVGKAPETTFDR